MKMAGERSDSVLVITFVVAVSVLTHGKSIDLARMIFSGIKSKSACFPDSFGM